MVKTKVGGGKRYAAAVKAKAQGASTPTWEGPAPAKHLQRKISKKVNFLDKVAASKVAALSAKSVILKKGKKKVSKALTDLSSLSGSVNELLQQHGQKPGTAKGRLGHLAAGQKGKKRRQKTDAGDRSEAGEVTRRKFGEAVGTLRARSAILAKESGRVQQVLAHPLYKLDPIQAITNHLSATLPAVAPPPRQDTKHKKKKGPKKGKSGDMMED